MKLPTTLSDILLACEKNVFCPECGGISQWETKVLCRDCNGRGELAHDETRCSVCRGRGVVFDSSRTSQECVACDGYGVLFLECAACNARGFTHTTLTCDHCDSDGTVPFSRTVLDNADHKYVMRLLGHMLHYTESDQKAELLNAARLLSLFDSLFEDLPNVDEVDGDALLAGIDTELLNSTREQIASRLESVRQQELAVAQQEREQARADQIREATMRQNEVAAITSEMQRKYGRS
jgi:RecJ-like exonuclease